MNIKHLFTILVAAVLLFGSCAGPAQNKLRVSVEELNKELPVDNGNGTIIDSVAYLTATNTVMFYYTVDESYTTVSSLRAAEAAQRRFFASFLASNKMATFTHLLVDAGANLELEYTGRDTHEKVTLAFSADEIKACLNDDNPLTDREQLAALIEITNSRCPMGIDGENLVMTGVYLKGDNIEFHYTYNPDEYQFDQADVEELSSAMLPELRNELAGEPNQYQLMKKLGVGVQYFFEADGHNMVTFGFTCDQI